MVSAAIVALRIALAATATQPRTPDAGQPFALPPIAPTPPARPNEGTYRLWHAPDGSYVYDDIRFEARIAPDGHVTFKDIHLRLETYVFGVPLRRYKTDGNERRPSVVGALRQAIRGDIEGALPIDPSLCPANSDPGRSAGPCRLALAPITLVGKFDLTDEVMNLTGQGWYRYEKAKFISATFEFRVKLAAEEYRKRLTEAVADLPHRFDLLWSDLRYTAREKRRIICLTWAEVDLEDPATRIAAERIIAWVRRGLPQGSAAAYSDDEVAGCPKNGARSFQPYDNANDR